MLSIVKDVADSAMVGTGTDMPFPVIDTVTGLLDALCVMVNVPVFVPVVVGRNVTITAWLLFALMVKEIVDRVNVASEDVMFVI